MIRVNLKEARGQLDYLLDEAVAGENVVIERLGSAIRLVALETEPTAAGPAEDQPIGDRLDRFVGTWTAEDEAQLRAATEIFERIDDSFWS